jgi:hypothetical protein
MSLMILKRSYSIFSSFWYCNFKHVYHPITLLIKGHYPNIATPTKDKNQNKFGLTLNVIWPGATFARLNDYTLLFIPHISALCWNIITCCEGRRNSLFLLLSCTAIRILVLFTIFWKKYLHPLPLQMMGCVHTTVSCWHYQDLITLKKPYLII